MDSYSPVVPSTEHGDISAVTPELFKAACGSRSIFVLKFLPTAAT